MKKVLCFALSLILVLSMAVVPTLAAPAAGVGYQEVTDQTVPDGAVDIMTFTQNVESLEDSDYGKAFGYSFAAYAAATKISISTPEGLALFATIVNSGVNGTNNTRFQGKTVYLANDINMATWCQTHTWVPIANDTANDLNGTGGYPCFRGTFDGLGRTIDGLTVTSNASGNVNVALFGFIGGANIKNLVIGENCSFTYTGTSANARTAALVGRIMCAGGDNAGAGTDATGLTVATKIENVKNLATVSSTTFAGGIVGATRFATNLSILFKNVTNEGTVTGNSYAAGILGYAQGRYFDFESCVNTGDIISNGNAAGILYNAYNGVDKDVFIQKCYVSGKIQGANVDPLVLAAKTNMGYINLANNTVSDAVLAIGTQIGYDPAKVVKADLTSASPITAIEANFNANSVYYISTPEELIFFANYVNGATTVTDAKTTLWGKTVYLKNDIDMTGKNMAPIGSVATGTDYANPTVARSFAGTFDGQGYVIDNLKITSDAANVGLFGILLGGTVKNVVLGSGCEIAGGANVGAIAGMARRCQLNQASRIALTGAASNDIHQPNSSIENCFSAAKVTATGYAAGILGTADGDTNGVLCSRVFACTNVGEVTGGTYAAGILANANNRQFLVVSCRNAGAVAANKAAGICAYLNVDNTKFAVVSSSVNNGEINGTAVSEGIVAEKPYTNSVVSACTNYAGADEIDTAWVNVKYVGTQVKDNGDGTYNVRFLATVNDLTAFNQVGFQIVAAYGENTSNAAKGTKTTNKVFTSIVAAEGNANPAEYGGCYFVAVTVTGVSDSYGNVTFTVNTVQDGAVSTESYEVVYNAGELVD